MSKQGETGNSRGMSTERVEKRPYAPPSLKKFGAVTDLTAGGGGSAMDGNGKPHMRMSDRGSKHILSSQPCHPMGFGVYIFSYKPEFQAEYGHGLYKGYISQEVSELVPEAVQQGPSGHLLLDYSRIPPLAGGLQ